jgi:hypothetical protein
MLIENDEICEKTRKRLEATKIDTTNLSSGLIKLSDTLDGPHQRMTDDLHKINMKIESDLETNWEQIKDYKVPSNLSENIDSLEKIENRYINNTDNLDKPEMKTFNSYDNVKSGGKFMGSYSGSGIVNHDKLKESGEKLVETGKKRMDDIQKVRDMLAKYSKDTKEKDN